MADQEVWNEIQRARERAHRKHGDNSIESIPSNDPRWLSILVEELGEIAHELTYDSGGTPVTLRRELIDLLSVASAWVDALDGQLMWPTKSDNMRAALEQIYAATGNDQSLGYTRIREMAHSALGVDLLCVTCGRDNRNKTHDALELTGHLDHSFTN